jgi:phosphohistidine phosphatase
MDLYLIRHADAASLEDAGVASDEERPLTRKGHAQAQSLAVRFRRRGVTFDAIITSPLLRARQTTDGLVARMGVSPPIVVFDEIGFEVRPRKICEYLRKLGEVATVAIIGHQPGLSRFAAWLSGSKKTQLDLSKAGFALLKCDELKKGGGVLNLLTSLDWIG